VQPLWKSIWKFLIKLKIELSYDSVLPLLGIYLKERKSIFNRDACKPIFIAALFTIAKFGISLGVHQLMTEQRKHGIHTQ
jgi:hypothetical protein